MKALLVIDLPTDDIENYFMRYELNYMKCSTGKYVSYVKLKPLPEKIEVDVKKTEDIMHVEFQTRDLLEDKIIADIKLGTDKLIALGWNSCIDKILGE